MYLLLWSLFIFYIFDTCLGDNEVYSVVKSCYRARFDVDAKVDFCNMVSWQAGRLYATNNFSIYNPSNYLSDSSQNQYAINLYNYYTGSGSAHGLCHMATKNLACAESFPYCPEIGIGISYSKICKLQCEQVNANCPFSISCNNYSSSSSCSIYLPSGFYVLPSDHGPYSNLITLYFIMSIFWGAMLIYLFVWSFYFYSDKCLRISKLYTGIFFCSLLIYYVLNSKHSFLFICIIVFCYFSILLLQ